MANKVKIPKVDKTFKELYKNWENIKNVHSPMTAQALIKSYHKYDLAQFFHEVLREMANRYLASEGFKNGEKIKDCFNKRKGGDVLEQFLWFCYDINKFDDEVAESFKDEMLECLNFKQIQPQQMMFYAFLENVGINLRDIFNDPWMVILNLNHPNSQRNMLIAIASDSPEFEIEHTSDIIQDKTGKYEAFFKKQKGLK